MERKIDVEYLICSKIKPIYIGGDIAGYFISEEDFKTLLSFLNDKEE